MMKQSINFSKNAPFEFKSEETIQKVEICHKTSSKILQTNRQLQKHNIAPTKQANQSSNMIEAHLTDYSTPIYRLKYFLIACTLVQFLILFTLVLIYFLALFVKLAIFITLEASLIAIYLFLVLTMPNPPPFPLQPPKEQNKNIPENNQIIFQGHNQNLSCSNRPGFTFQASNIKLEGMSVGSANRERVNKDELTQRVVKNSLNISILSKILQSLLSITIPTIFLSSNLQKIQEKTALFALIISSYTISFITIGVFAIFIRKIQKWLDSQLPQSVIQGSNNSDMQSHPLILVHHGILKQKQSQAKSQRTIISFQKSIKSVKYVDIENEVSEPKEYDQKGKCQNKQKICKKSVLKSRKGASKQLKVDIIPQKRRVQINEKTVQLFEYVQISPNDSSGQSRHKIINGKQIVNRRLLQIRKKWHEQADALQAMRMKKERKVKSLITLS